MSRKKRFAAAVLLTLYLAALMRLTVLRPGFLLPQEQVRLVNLRPLNAYAYWIRVGSWRVFWVDLVGNLVCFCPFGSFLSLMRPKWSLGRAAAAGLGLSVCIELSQFLLGTGVADIDDLVLNTLGVALGFVLTQALTGRRLTIGRLMRLILDNKSLMWVLFAGYLAVLLRLTVLRDGLLPLHLFQGGVLDLLPLAYYVRRARRSLPWLLLREFGGNIVGFMPLGTFLTWRRPERGAVWVLGTGAAVSALIEASQIVFGVGRCSTGDVALNAFGAFLGAKLMYFLFNSID